MRNRRWYLAAFLTALFLPTPDTYAATEIRIATIAPAGTSYVQTLRAAADDIRERTEGRVNIRYYPGGVMGSDQAVLRRMRVGQLQGAIVPAGGVAHIHPDAQVYSMPFLFRSIDEVQHVRAQMDETIRDRIESRDYVLAGIGNGGFTYLYSKDRIANLDDLRRARIWTPEGDAISPRMFEQAGIRTVSLPVADVYTGLQTGMVDSAAVNPAGAIALQWHTQVNYQLDAPLTFLVAMLVLDRGTFERLNEADRTTVRQVFDEVFRNLDSLVLEDNRNAAQVLRDRGIELVQPTHPPEERAWEQLAADALTHMEAEGRFDSALLAEIHSLLNDYREDQRD